MIRRAIIAAALFVSACSVQPPISFPEGQWQEHQRKIATIQHWQLSGKLGFRAPDQGGSASVTWTQHQTNYVLLLSGPFGAGSAKISGDQHYAEMLYRDELYRDSPEQLALQLTHLPLPVDALSWWARGLPSPSQAPATQLSTCADGLASGFQQNGWQLSFSRYAETKAGILPRKIVGTLNAGENRLYSFKLIISDWIFFNQE